MPHGVGHAYALASRLVLMPRTDQQATPSVAPIHFSLVNPVTAQSTPCGAVGHATKAWAYVTCPVCLGRRPSRRCSR
jgi:hypothetical protein